MHVFTKGLYPLLLLASLNQSAEAAFDPTGTVVFSDGGVRVWTGTLGITGNESLSFLHAANGSDSVSSVTIDGPATVFDLNGIYDRLSVYWGRGDIMISGGALVDATDNPDTCIAANCNNFIGSAAGSNATLTITGAGSTLSTISGFFVASTAVFTQANDGFDFGTPNATTTGLVNILDQGMLNTEAGTIGLAPAGPTAGSEQAFGTVNVNGSGSTWNLNGDRLGSSQLFVGSGENGSGELNVTNAGGVNITSTVDGQNAALQVGRGSGTTGSVNVTSSGSLEIREQGAFTVDTGAYLNVGREAGNGSMTIDGGQVSIVSDNNEAFAGVGRDGGTGSMELNGTGSLSLQGGSFSNIFVGRGAGANGNISVDNGSVSIVSSGGSAALQVGRDGGTGVVTLSNQSELTTQGAAGSFLQLGRGGGNGNLSVVGGSSLSINESGAQNDDLAALIDVGRDSGGIGTMTVQDSSVTVASNNNWSIFRVGRQDAGTRGTATLDNSTVSLSSLNRDALVQVGRDSGAEGVLTVTGGGGAFVELHHRQ